MITPVALDLPTAGWTVAVARHALGGLLGAAGVAASIAADLSLALSEACANAVCHASTGLSYRVRLCVDDSRCLMEVHDRGPGFVLSDIPTPGLDSYRSRGLLIMRAVLDKVHVDALRPNGIRVVMVKNWHSLPGHRADSSVPMLVKA